MGSDARFAAAFKMTDFASKKRRWGRGPSLYSRYRNFSSHGMPAGFSFDGRGNGHLPCSGQATVAAFGNGLSSRPTEGPYRVGLCRRPCHTENTFAGGIGSVPGEQRGPDHGDISGATARAPSKIAGKNLRGQTWSRRRRHGESAFLGGFDRIHGIARVSCGNADTRDDGAGVVCRSKPGADAEPDRMSRTGHRSAGGLGGGLPWSRCCRRSTCTPR